MKLETLSQILNEMPSTPRATGNVESYGLILHNPSSHRINYDEIEDILVFTDKTKFQIHLAKMFAEFTGDKDDVFLSFDEICEDDRFDQFTQVTWFWDLFR